MIYLRKHLSVLFSVFVSFVFLGLYIQAQPPDPLLYAGMKWRSIGPFRAGRVSAVAGIPGNASIYYMASPWHRNTIRRSGISVSAFAPAI